MAASTDQGDEKHRASQAVESLQGRLHTLEQHLSLKNENAEHEDPASERLHNLGRDIEDIADESEAVARLLELYKKHRSDLYLPISDYFGSPSAMEKLAIVTSCAASVSGTVSQLTLLKSLPIPPSESLAALANLSPRAASLGLLQSRQAEDVSELRVRTASLLQRWHTLSIIGVGSCWAEWEDRLLRLEAIVRQAEAAEAAEELGP